VFRIYSISFDSHRTGRTFSVATTRSGGLLPKLGVNQTKPIANRITEACCVVNIEYWTRTWDEPPDLWNVKRK